MKSKTINNAGTLLMRCFNPLGITLGATAPLLTIGRLVKAPALCAVLAMSGIANAQDTVAMVDHNAMSAAGSQASPSAVVQGLNDEGVVAVTAVKEGGSKRSITGLEPGTLALIGFGLLALAATRRNAR